MTLEEVKELRVRVHDLNVELRKARETIAGHDALFQEIGRREGRTARKFQRMRARLKQNEALLDRALERNKKALESTEIERLRGLNAQLEIRLHDAIAAMKAVEDIQGHDEALVLLRRFLLVYG